MRVLVLTISDRAAGGFYEDESGPAVAAAIREAIPAAEIDLVVVPDDGQRIETALRGGLGHDVILTTGGTGFGPKDITPEVTRRLCQRPAPGIAELLRRESFAETPNAVLSRGEAGIREQTLIVNLPGSVRGASFSARILAPVLEHAVRMMAGGGH
jgi:molybdenum cofactor synthesis domain-containing protein